jgi:hypothetical protein
MLKYFKFFYGYLGNAVFVVLFASLFVALLDGVGLDDVSTPAAVRRQR